jgi:hypothetical protein
MSKPRIFASRELGNILSDFLKPMSGADSGFLNRIIADWHLIVGEEISRKARPIKITKRGETVLHLQVKEGFQLELQYMEPLLLEKIAVYFGYKAVARFRYSGMETKPMAKKPQVKTLTAEEKSALLETTGKIDDEDLRKSLEKLGTAVLENDIS